MYCSKHTDSETSYMVFLSYKLVKESNFKEYIHLRNVRKSHTISFQGDLISLRLSHQTNNGQMRTALVSLM